MSGVLVIGSDDQQRIAMALMAARLKPTPWSVMQPFAEYYDEASPTLKLADRAAAFDEIRRAYPSQHLMLGTYHAAISYEEQPAGLFKHLSVSSRAPGKVPGPEVMAMVCQAFGFSHAVCDAFTKNEGEPIKAVARVWVEEFEPKRFAINIVELES